MSWIYVCSFERSEKELCWGYKMEVIIGGEQSLTCIIRVATCVQDWELVVFKETHYLLATVI